MLEAVERAAKDQERPFLADQLDRGGIAHDSAASLNASISDRELDQPPIQSPLPDSDESTSASHCIVATETLIDRARPRASSALLSRLHNSRGSPHLRRVLRQYELVEKVRSYDPDADEGLINRAYVFSMKAHGAQVRASGDPYFSHPIEVAGILTDLKLDDQTIVTAILHDTIEDTLATPEEIEKHVRQGRRPAGRRRHQAQQDRGAVGERARRRESAQVPARAQRRHPRAAGQARRPAAQHAHAPPHPAARRSAAASPARRWISTPRSPSGSACTR